MEAPGLQQPGAHSVNCGRGSAERCKQHLLARTWLVVLEIMKTGFESFLGSFFFNPDPKNEPKNARTHHRGDGVVHLPRQARTTDPLTMAWHVWQ